MRKFWSFIIFLFLFISFTENAFAQEMIISPQNVNLGDLVNVQITNIPIPAQATGYNVNLKLSTVSNSTLIGNVQLLTEGSNCTVRVPSDAWTSKGAPTCTGSGPFTFTGVLDTSKFGDSTSTIDIQYTVEFAGGGKQIATGNFSIKASKQSAASFQIESVVPDPVVAGQNVTIKISLTKKGTYGYGLAGGGLETKNCDIPGCELTLKTPQTLSKSTNVIVIDPDNNRLSATLNITQPTPSPTPPGPPCDKGYDQYGHFTTDSTKITSCSEINTALGFPFSTDPGEFVKTIFGIVLSLAGGIAILLIIFSGYGLMFSQGNPEKVQAAREQLTAAIVGLLFIIFSMSILQIIGVDILHIPGLTR